MESKAICILAHFSKGTVFLRDGIPYLKDQVHVLLHLESLKCCSSLLSLVNANPSSWVGSSQGPLGTFPLDQSRLQALLELFSLQVLLSAVLWKEHSFLSGSTDTKEGGMLSVYLNTLYLNSVLTPIREH